MIGQTILHYKILEKLGEGGMGVVYKAQDINLDRIVALKFLPHRVSESEQDKTRFIQEAKSAAVLNHPNICTVHGIEQKDEDVFIVMECVDGVTLRKKIETGQLAINDAVTYAVQIGEALQEAEKKN
jgi:serine/threonine protein kinase